MARIARGFWMIIYVVVALGALLAGVGIVVYTVMEWVDHNTPPSIGLLLVGLAACVVNLIIIGALETDRETPAEAEQQLKALRRALGKE